MSKFAPILLFVACCLTVINASTMQANTINSETSIKQFDFNISPNPAKDDINIEFTENISGIIFIHDNLGNQVLEVGINNKSNKDISLENLSSGIYFISVKTDNKTVIKRLIKY